VYDFYNEEINRERKKGRKKPVPVVAIMPIIHRRRRLSDADYSVRSSSSSSSNGWGREHGGSRVGWGSTILDWPRLAGHRLTPER